MFDSFSWLTRAGRFTLRLAMLGDVCLRQITFQTRWNASYPNFFVIGKIFPIIIFSDLENVELPAYRLADRHSARLFRHFCSKHAVSAGVCNFLESTIKYKTLEIDLAFNSVEQ